MFSSISLVNDNVSTFGVSAQNAILLSRRSFWWFFLEARSWLHGTWSGSDRKERHGTQGGSVLQRSLKSFSVQMLSLVGFLRAATVC